MELGNNVSGGICWHNAICALVSQLDVHYLLAGGLRMKPNPYESPASDTGNRAAPRGRTLAIVLWSLDVVLTWQSAVALNSPGVAERYEENPSLFTTVTIIGIVSPIVGIGLLGIASWRWSWRTAIVGAVTLLGPLTVFLAWHAVRRFLAATLS